MEVKEGQCLRSTRLSHRSYLCKYGHCGQRFGKEEQLKQHIKDEHADEKHLNLGSDGIKDAAQIPTTISENTEQLNNLDGEDVLDKFDKFDKLTISDKKDYGVRVMDNQEEIEEEKENPLEWIQSKEALERMELIMKGQFHSRRHVLFLDKVK